jgi:hypothetical protein
MLTLLPLSFAPSDGLVIFRVGAVASGARCRRRRWRELRWRRGGRVRRAGGQGVAASATAVDDVTDQFVLALAPAAIARLHRATRRSLPAALCHCE